MPYETELSAAGSTFCQLFTLFKAPVTINLRLAKLQLNKNVPLYVTSREI